MLPRTAGRALRAVSRSASESWQKTHSSPAPGAATGCSTFPKLFTATSNASAFSASARFAFVFLSLGHMSFHNSKPACTPACPQLSSLVPHEFASARHIIAAAVADCIVSVQNAPAPLICFRTGRFCLVCLASLLQVAQGLATTQTCPPTSILVSHPSSLSSLPSWASSRLSRSCCLKCGLNQRTTPRHR